MYIEKQNFLEKTYAGIVGMHAGMILGAQVEIGPWNSKNIEYSYGKIEELMLYDKTFAADDDSNGPLFFIRSLKDCECPLTSEDIKNAWLNYVRYEKGMFWWGPSTERKAYENLKNGILPPDSGSVEQNGDYYCNQIGGQIFIDTWGMISAGDMNLSKQLAVSAAQVSHDQNGVQGAIFISSCISLAYIESDVYKIISQALENLDSNSEYYKIVKTALKNYDSNMSFEDALLYLETTKYNERSDFGHIIPNAYVCVISLLYGNGDFNKVVVYATKSGWDTDCNASNVGAISGILTDISSIDKKYRNYINDTIIASSAIGSMNIIDIPNFVNLLWDLRKKLHGESSEILEERTYKFELPYSTHGITSSSTFHANIIGLKEKGLRIPINMLVQGNDVFISKKTFYYSCELVDERYSPVFSPTIYPGETIQIKYSYDHFNDHNVYYQGFVKLADNQIVELARPSKFDDNGIMTFKIPKDIKLNIVEFGFIISSQNIKRQMEFGILDLHEIKIYGKAAYDIDFKFQSIDFNSVTPFSHENGSHYIDKYYFEHNGNETVLNYTSNVPTTSLAGYHAHKNYSLIYDFMISEGESINIYFYALGLNNHYSISLLHNNVLRFGENINGVTYAVDFTFNWNYYEIYRLNLIPSDNLVKIYIDDSFIGECIVKRNYGLHGYGTDGPGCGKIFKIHLEEH